MARGYLYDISTSTGGASSSGDKRLRTLLEYLSVLADGLVDMYFLSINSKNRFEF